MNILVKFEHFIKYQDEYDTTYLDKKNGYEIWAPSKSRMLNGFKPVLEMFDGTITEYVYTSDSNDIDMCINFKTNSNTKYRLDLSKEPNTNIYYLAFSLDNVDIENYEEVTKMYESKEVFSRIAYILKDLTKEYNIHEYCIGATGNKKKDILYSSMMRYVDSWEKRDTPYYDLGWALYFKI
jgi:hypothetical protein